MRETNQPPTKIKRKSVFHRRGGLWASALLGLGMLLLPVTLLAQIPPHAQRDLRAIDGHYAVQLISNKSPFAEPVLVDATTSPNPTDLIGLLNGPIPMYYGAKVEDYLQLYTRQERAAFEAVLGFGKLWFPFFEEELRKNELPVELKYLPVALSALNPGKVSTTGGVGVWQLRHSFATRFGLRTGPDFDERRSIERSTVAAVKTLKMLHEQFGDWSLTLAAYVAGPAVVQKAIQRSGSQPDGNLWQLLPPEAQTIYPQFVAASVATVFHRKYLLNALSIQYPTKAEAVEIKMELPLQDISDLINVPVPTLRELNPLLRRDTFPLVKEGKLWLPPGKSEVFNTEIDSLYTLLDSLAFPVANNPLLADESGTTAMEAEMEVKAEPKIPENSARVNYTIQSGDNLGRICAWYRVNLADLKQWNGLENDRIDAGQKLEIYVPRDQVGQYAKLAEMTFEQKQATIGIIENGTDSTEPVSVPVEEESGEYVYYTVKSGDSVWAIAQQFPGVSDADIMRLNGISTDIQPGQRLKIKKIE